MNLTITTAELARLENIFSSFQKLNNCETFWKIETTADSVKFSISLPFSCSVSAASFFFDCAVKAYVNDRDCRWSDMPGESFCVTYALIEEAPASLAFPENTARTNKKRKEWEAVWAAYCEQFPRYARNKAECIAAGYRGALREKDVVEMKEDLAMEPPFLPNFDIYGKDLFLVAHKIMDDALFPEKATKALREALRLYGMPNESPHALEGYWEREMSRPGARNYYSLFTREN